MFKRNRGRLSRREQIELNNAADRFYASCADKEPRAQVALPPKRDRVYRPADGEPVVPYEKDILADVLRALRSDPRVGYVWRQTSGTFQDGSRWIKAGPVGMPDLCGILTSSGRFFGLEVKRPGKKPEPHQEQRLEHFRQCGAVAGYCWSVESALALLP